MTKKSDYTYFRMPVLGNKSLDGYIRLDSSRVDAEWKQMCTDEGRKFPCEVFRPGLPTKIPVYEHVTLSDLRRVTTARAIAVETLWQQCLDESFPTAMPTTDSPCAVMLQTRQLTNEPVDLLTGLMTNTNTLSIVQLQAVEFFRGFAAASLDDIFDDARALGRLAWIRQFG